MADVKQNEEFIQLKKNSILKIGIKDSEGNPTGEHLEFDLESIEYPLKLNECEKKHRKNVSDLNARLTILKKQEDKKGKYSLSWKEEEEIRIWREFYLKDMEALDYFFGKNGCKKLLNGRDPYYSMYDDFSEIIESIMPKLKTNAEDIKAKIRSKYSNKEKGILE